MDIQRHSEQIERFYVERMGDRIEVALPLDGDVATLRVESLQATGAVPIPLALLASAADVLAAAVEARTETDPEPDEPEAPSPDDEESNPE